MAAFSHGVCEFSWENTQRGLSLGQVEELAERSGDQTNVCPSQSLKGSWCPSWQKTLKTECCVLFHSLASYKCICVL